MKTAITCKTCRRLGMSVCGKVKCAFKRKPYPPGVHGRAFRRGASEYGTQLAEKQKMKFSYGLREKQFSNYVSKAVNQKAMPTGDALVTYLETRLDNAVYRLGFASSRAAARQIVNHGHIMVDGKRVSIPSYKVLPGKLITVRQQSLGKGFFSNIDSNLKKHETPTWLELDREKKTGRVASHPQRDSLDEMERSFNINAIVEYYSR